MNIGNTVVLNEAGISCYNRNKNYKKINPGKTMTIVEHLGFDNKKAMYKVQYDGKTDVYFQYCLELYNPTK